MTLTPSDTNADAIEFGASREEMQSNPMGDDESDDDDASPRYAQNPASAL